MFKKFVKVEKFCVSSFILLTKEELASCEVERGSSEKEWIQQASNGAAQESGDKALARKLAR